MWQKLMPTLALGFSLSFPFFPGVGNGDNPGRNLVRGKRPRIYMDDPSSDSEQ